MTEIELNEEKEFAAQLSKDAELLLKTEYMKDVSRLLKKASITITKLANGYKNETNLYKNIAESSKLELADVKMKLEKCWSTLTLYKTLLGEDTAELIERSAKRLWLDSKRNEKDDNK